MNRLARRFLILGLALSATLVTGTVGFTLIDHYPVFDAFYMTLITMTTVGYQEVHPLSPAGRVFNSFFLLFGVSAMFLAVGLVTQTAVELQLKDFYARRRRGRRLEDHVRCLSRSIDGAGVPAALAEG